MIKANNFISSSIVWKWEVVSTVQTKKLILKNEQVFGKTMLCYDKTIIVHAQSGKIILLILMLQRTANLRVFTYT